MTKPKFRKGEVVADISCLPPFHRHKLHGFVQVISDNGWGLRVRRSPDSYSYLASKEQLRKLTRKEAGYGKR